MSDPLDPLAPATDTPATDITLSDLYWTRKGLSKFLRRSTRTVYRMYQERTGPPVTKLGGEYLYNKRSVLRWLADHEQRPRRRRA